MGQELRDRERNRGRNGGAAPFGNAPLFGTVTTGPLEPIPPPSPPTPVAAPPPPPVIFEETNTCTICQGDFRHQQRVCRISCCHCVHAECWEQYHQHTGSMQRPSASCPNCRASNPHLTAIWHWIDPDHVALTQDIGGRIPTNLLAPATVSAPSEPPVPTAAPSDPPVPPEVSTPPSYTPDVADSRSPVPPPYAPGARSRSPTRSTSPYFMRVHDSPYPGHGAGASTVLDSAPPSPVILPLSCPLEAGSRESSLLLGPHATSYHIRSQLSDGRPSLLIDPGSVGNLC